MTSRLDADHEAVAASEVHTDLARQARDAFAPLGIVAEDWWQALRPVTTSVLGLLTLQANDGVVHHALLLDHEVKVGRSHLRVHPALVPVDRTQQGFVVGEEYSLVVEGQGRKGWHAAKFSQPSEVAKLIEQVSLQVHALAHRHAAARRLECDDLLARATLLHAFETRTLPQRLLPFASSAFFEEPKALAQSRTMAGLYWALAATAYTLRPQPMLTAYLKLSRLLPRLQPGLFDGPMPVLSEED